MTAARAKDIVGLLYVLEYFSCEDSEDQPKSRHEISRLRRCCHWRTEVMACQLHDASRIRRGLTGSVHGATKLAVMTGHGKPYTYTLIGRKGGSTLV